MKFVNFLDVWQFGDWVLVINFVGAEFVSRLIG